MYNFHLIVFTGALIYLLYRYYRALNGKIKMFSISFYFCLWYVIYNLVGSTLLNCMRFEYEANVGIYSHSGLLFNMWIYTIMGFVGLFIGFSFSHYLYGKHMHIKDIKIRATKTNILQNQYDSSIRNFYFILLLFFLSVAVLLYYRHEIGGFPLESILLGLQGSDLALLRSDATNNFSGKYYRYVLFMEVLPMFLFIFVSFIKSNKRKWKLLYSILGGYNIVWALITLQKAPIINFILLCYIIYSFKEKEIKKKPLIISACISIPIIVLMYVFFMGVSGELPISELIELPLHRIFIDAIIPFYWYIKYTNEFGFLYGASFPNPGGIFPFEHFSLTKELSTYVNGASDVVGSMPTVFIGEMYSNFGVIGIVISSIAVGFILQTLDILFWKKMSRRKSVLISTLYIFMITYLYRYTFSGISGIIFDANLYFVLILTLLFYRREKRFKLLLGRSIVSNSKPK